MNVFLTLASLFFIGSVLGWILELFYRRLTSKQHKWMNPGFCTGPYVPLYGCGLCLLYLIAGLESYLPFANAALKKAVLFLLMAVCMTAIEYLAGIISLRCTKVRLWDYSDEWGNVQGIICPKYSLCWALLGAVYYFFIHPYILDALKWLSANLAFSFVIGVFFGVFAVDAAKSAELVARLKRFAEENQVIVRYEAIKADIQQKCERANKKYHFFRPFRTEIPLTEHLKEMKESFEKVRSKIRRS